MIVHQMLLVVRLAAFIRVCRAVEICKLLQSGSEERVVAVKRLTSQAAVDIAQFASEANILRKLVNE